MKVIKLIVINLVVFVSLVVFCGVVWEGGLRFYELFGPSRPAATLRSDIELGWNSIPEVRYIGDSSAQDKIAFIGDSFTQGTAWPALSISYLNERERRFRGDVLGVAGYGTIQSFLKLSRHLEQIKPKVVVLLFFAWNDMRDNYDRPGIYYNDQTRIRPYYENTGEEATIKFPNPADALMPRLRVFQEYVLPALMKADEKLAGSADFDSLVKARSRALVGYGDVRSWRRFYDPSKQDDEYVRESWAATTTALLSLRDKVEGETHAKLLIVGIDNAFTVDEDVKVQWIGDSGSFDPSLPLSRLGEIARLNGVRYVNALPVLKELRSKLGKKVYNGPSGNLAGHLEPEGDDAIGRLVAEEVLRLDS
jgi:hypothetical protein